MHSTVRLQRVSSIRPRPLYGPVASSSTAQIVRSTCGVQVWDAVSEALQQQVRAVDRKLSVLRLQTTGAALPRTPADGRQGS